MTAVTLDAPMAAGATAAENFMGVVLPQDVSTDSELWIMPGASTSDGTTFQQSPFDHGPAPMIGLASHWYGSVLCNITQQELGTDPDGFLRSNMPSNTNTDLFGGPQGPVNKTALSMDRADIPVGTKVAMTIDLNGLVPQAVLVMGGEPLAAVTYDSDANGGDGQLVVQGCTCDTTTAAGEALGSVFGLIVITDPGMAVGEMPLRLVAQTTAWAGDFFPLYPGEVAHSDNVDTVGTGSVGAFTARCGSSFYGPTGASRTARLWLPDYALAHLFGAEVTATDVTGFQSDDRADGAVVSSEMRFGESGVKAVFPITFASGKDATFGVSDAVRSVDLLVQDGDGNTVSVIVTHGAKTGRMTENIDDSWTADRLRTATDDVLELSTGAVARVTAPQVPICMMP